MMTGGETNLFGRFVRASNWRGAVFGRSIWIGSNFCHVLLLVAGSRIGSFISTATFHIVTVFYFGGWRRRRNGRYFDGRQRRSLVFVRMLRREGSRFGMFTEANDSWGSCYILGFASSGGVVWWVWTREAHFRRMRTFYVMSGMIVLLMSFGGTFTAPGIGKRGCGGGRQHGNMKIRRMWMVFVSRCHRIVFVLTEMGGKRVFFHFMLVRICRPWLENGGCHFSRRSPRDPIQTGIAFRDFGVVGWREGRPIVLSHFVAQLGSVSQKELFVETWKWW